MQTVFQAFRRKAFLYFGLLATVCMLSVSSCKKDDPEEVCGQWEYEGEFGPEH